MSASLLAGLTYSRHDIVLLMDEAGRIVDVNALAVDAYGYSREELLGMSIGDLRVAADNTQFETLHRRKDGTFFPVEVSAGLRCVGEREYQASIVRDVGRKESEQQLSRTTRALRVLSSCSRAVIQAQDEARLFADTCQIITDAGGYAMAWIGIAQNDERKSVRAAAARGFGAADYLDAHGITWGDEPNGRGPTGTCIREGRTAVCRYSDSDPDFSPWRQKATRHDYNSCLALPLRSEGQIIGALTIYATEPDAFDPEETRLLEELAANLSFGVEARRRQTERDRVEEALRESETRFRTVFESANDGIVIVDLEGRILEANTIICRRLGYTREEFLQMKIRQIDPAGCDDQMPERLAGSLQKGGEIFEAVHVRKDGSQVPVEVSSRIFEYRGKSAFLAVARDITERKRAQAEAVERAAELERAKTEAERANRAKSEFLTRMSHEMRTPLNGITGMTNLLLDTPLTGEQREFAEILRRSSQGLLAVIDDILDLSKIEAGRMELDAAAFDIVDCVRKAAELMAPQARAKGLAFPFHASVACPLVKGDIYRVRQIVLNLMGNAIKFTEQGSVESRVASSALPDGRAVFQISVKDTGIGIAPEHLPRLFSNFTQVDSSVARKHEGSGLGLVISLRLAELMGGALNATSELGRSSEFVLTLTLPCVQESAPAESAPAQGPAEHPAPTRIPLPPRARRVLLAEDNPVNKRLAVHILEKLGCLVDVATNGLEAVQMAECFPYEAIFMDCRMPELDGYAATREIRARQLLPSRVPIVALTAHAIVGAREECLAAGMDDYISKPVHPSDLEGALAKWCP